MAKTKTYRYDTAEHLRTPEEMALHLEAGLEESNGDGAFRRTDAGSTGNYQCGPSA